MLCQLLWRGFKLQNDTYVTVIRTDQILFKVRTIINNFIDGIDKPQETNSGVHQWGDLAVLPEVWFRGTANYIICIDKILI